MIKLLVTIALLAVLGLAACAPTQEQIDRTIAYEARNAILLWPELGSIGEEEVGAELWRCLVKFVADNGRKPDQYESVGIIRGCDDRCAGPV